MEIQRNLYLQKLIACQHDGQIKVITGLRRCGKSFLLFHLFKNYLLDNSEPIFYGIFSLFVSSTLLMDNFL